MSSSRAFQWARDFYNHPAGPKTVFFWAPTFKWSLGLANIADYNRPPEKVSYPQQSAAAVTGLIFMKYSVDIVPVNWNLFSVNAFLSATAMWQLARKLHQDYVVNGPPKPEAITENDLPFSHIPSDLPFSHFPSDLPFSHFPSDLPFSHFPSDLPFSHFPSDLPFSHFPSDLPFSHFPSDLPFSHFPSDLPFSYFPSDLPFSHFPSDLPFSHFQVISRSPTSQVISRSPTSK
ncbi:unnamed protein product [Closterium sp. NIES-64]|nr:unnamed protein product [Closterium sp. NIES-64]